MTKKIVKYFKLRDPRINHINFVKLLPKTGEEKEETDEPISSVIPIRKTLFFSSLQILTPTQFHPLSFQMFINSRRITPCPTCVDY